jgi:Domain of unknown function (DUF4190)
MGLPPSDAPAPPPPPSEEPVYVHTQGTNGFSVASLVLGILWLFWLGSVLALVFGYIALGQIKSTGDRQGGKGLAIAGIVLGWVGVGFLALALVFGDVHTSSS